MEIIGGIIVAILLMSGAAVVGATFALLVFGLLRIRKQPARRACFIAAIFPPIAMGYMLGWLLFSSILSAVLPTPDFVFGDIREKLPNGYTLEALGKMPECGHIQKAGDDRVEVAWVQSAQVMGDYVAGQYDYTYFQRTPEDKERNYFLFDTRSGMVRNFASESDLAKAVNSSVHLVSTAYFHGARSVWEQAAAWSIYFLILAPPLLAALLLVYRLILIVTRGRQPNI